MMIECNCKLNNIWPFPASYCEHGKHLVSDALAVLTIIKKKDTIPDSVLNIIRGTNNVNNT
jgi:hypothetical protein